VHHHGGRAEGELKLVKRHVAGGDDAPGGDVVASVAAMISRVADEDAQRGRRVELVFGCYHRVGEAQAAKDAELTIVKVDAEMESVRRGGSGG
jgi:hypothetical protein